MRFLLCRRMLLWSVLLVGLGYSLPAFPGAEGFGARTPGGRGGKVFVVNTTSDDPAVYAPGNVVSLREAVEATGPRTVVFNVAGMIELDSSLRILNPNITIAGQTAPGDGICLKASDEMFNALIQIHTNDVIIRYLRIRPGEGKLGNEDIVNINEAPLGAPLDIIQPNMDCEVDGIAIYNGAKNVVVDHCSISWAVDENISIIDVSGSSEPSPNNISIQNCMVYQALAKSIHPKGLHSMGMLAGFGRIENVSIIRNVFALNNDRNPLIKTTGPIEVVNNIFYGYGNYHGAGTHFLLNVSEAFGTVDDIVSDVTNNAYIRRLGDSCPTDLRVCAENPSTYNVKLYAVGNLGSDEERVLSLSDLHTDNYKFGGVSHWKVETAAQITDTRTNRRAVSTVMATMLNSKLHNNVGANFPTIDVPDAIITENVKTFQGVHVNSVIAGAEVLHHEGEIVELKSLTGTAPYDSIRVNLGGWNSDINARLEAQDQVNKGAYKDYYIQFENTSGVKSDKYQILSYSDSSTTGSTSGTIGSGTTRWDHNILTIGDIVTGSQIKLDSRFPTGSTYRVYVNTVNGALSSWPDYDLIKPDGITPYPVKVDADANGMTDSWEAIYNVSSHSADPDNDGYTNIEEFLNGTTPNYIRVNGDASKRIRPLLVSPVEVPIAEYAAVRNILPEAFDLSGKPVTDVTWYDAVEYCNARSDSSKLERVYTITYVNGDPKQGYQSVTSDLTKNGFRLPTHEEWEYLYFGGVNKTEYNGFFFDPSTETFDEYSWYENNSDDSTHSIGLKKPNDFGLYDMCGNVWEWTNYETADGKGMLLGGAWNRTEIQLQGDRTYPFDKFACFFHSKSKYTGFRVVRNAPIDMTPINMLLLD